MQVAWSGELAGRAIDQWTREIPVIAERGAITDRNGELLAGNATKFSVFARSNAVTDAEDAAQKLSAALNIPYETVLKKLTGKRASEVTVAKKTDKKAVEKLAELSLNGVYFSRDNDRTYPKSDFLSQVIGFTSSDNTGAAGIEKYYDSYLRGKDGEILYETDLVGLRLNGAAAAYKPAENGYNLRLTIDAGIQTAAETALGRVAQQYSPKSAECIVLDPDTFEILAMACTPSYDLNNVPRDDIPLLNALSRNRIVCDIYEPGSTFKIITSAANLEEWKKGNKAAFSPTHVFSSSRTRTVDGTTVKCWSNHANGKHSCQTLADALNNSCNPCFTDMALALGKETFYDYLGAFGFGKTTGLDFGGEASGMLLPETAVRNCDLARIGFGQTVAVSGIQLACAAASCVNGGYYYEPRLVKEIYASDGYVLQSNTPKLKSRTVSEETSRLLAGMLEGVVEKGSGKKTFIEGYRVGGKTGTAQKYEDGRIAAGKYVSSFVGFFPANAPKYLALVIIDEPQGAYYGSVVAAPCAKEIFSSIIELKNIPPENIP
ncbi:MAG: stage V sporulation protein D [Firmicutes bacterium]|nr:stage V sporulation protein D [Bacillota bacterium]